MRRRPVRLEFAGFRLDADDRTLLRDGVELALTPKAFDTLLALVDRAGRVVSKQELLEAVWPGAFISEATLTQNIYTVRKALVMGGGEGLIQTLPRRGYRFTGKPVEVSSPADPTAQAGNGETARATAGIAGIRSIAVLPLVPLGDDEDSVFLGLGLADAVIASLSRLGRVTTRSTSSILRYVGERDRDPVRIGRELAVDGVLEGTIQKLGERLRATVQLVSVARGGACWAESFQGVYDDLFEAQDAIAHAVVAGLRLTLTRGESESLERRPTRSLDACRAYVRGRYFWNKRSADDLETALGWYERAVELDPEYAKAYAGLADAWILKPFYGSSLPAESFRRAQDAARRATELDPGLAEGHTSLGYTDFVYSRRWRTSEERFHRALACNPVYPTAHHWLGFLLTALGRHEEAIDRATRAHELDPLSPVIYTDLAMAHYFARRYEDAASMTAAVVETSPAFGYAHFAAALVASAQRRDREAVDSARTAAACLEGSTATRAVLGYALATSGEDREARRILASLGGGASRDAGVPVQAAHRALVLAGLGVGDEAFAELASACDERSNFAAFLSVWPVFDALRPDPRFAALLRRIRLAPS